jgi:TonB dependent receptor-like, beta-barrel/Carboxypeptidase regulatory-like domain/TonB-dependent Receptor Plug Domain
MRAHAHPARLTYLSLLLTLGAVAALPAQQRTVRGQVLGVRDSLPVAGAIVTAVGTGRGTLTDAAGRFALATPLGPVTLAIRSPTFVPDTVVLGPGQDVVTVYLHNIVIQLAPVEVQGAGLAARRRFQAIAQPSVITISPQEIRAAPTLLEPDVIRAVQLLPGTVARNDYSIGYNVRGGETDQNLVTLDGIPVFNPSHLAGLFSTFDADAVDHADFLTGGFPAGYSGRLSSVLDIVIKDGDSTRIHGDGAVSLLSSKLLLQGPLPGGGSWLGSVRRTYLDAVVSTFTSEVLPYYFTDALGKLHQPLGPHRSLDITGYWGKDALDMELVSATATRSAVRLLFDWGNRVLGATYRDTLAGVPLMLRGGVSEFSSTLGLLPSLARFDNRALLRTAALALTPPTWGDNALELGGSVESYAMDYGISSLALQTTLLDAHFRPTDWAAYVDDQWSPTSWLRLRPGLRVEHVPSAHFTGFAPRVAYKVFLSPNVALTGSAGRYFQTIHSIRDQQFPVTIYEFWIGADSTVPVARADHLVFGLEAWPTPALQLTVEGYRKTFDNLVTPDRTQDLREGLKVLPVSGDAWGVDVLLRRHVGNVRGWIAYSFVKATRVSQGVTYPPAQDRRHTVNVVLETHGPLHSDMAIRWGYGSPLPYTGFLGEWDHRSYSAIDGTFDEGEGEPIGGPINGQRYPPYTRLDAGFRWTWHRWGAVWNPYLQFVNLYNRQNVFLYFFDYGVTPPTRTGVSQLPFLPSFGIEVHF